MDHIKDTLANSKILEKLRERVTKNNHAQNEVIGLLSPMQRQQVVSVNFAKGRYIIRLKSAYGIMGVRHALRNLHAPVKVIVAD